MPLEDRRSSRKEQPMTQDTVDQSDPELDGAEVRICALCGHEESEHEKLEADGATPQMCRACDDEHDFEPEPDLE
jgi:hypothetical protein